MSQRSREVALKLPRLSPLRRPKAGDPHYSWYHADANRDGCGGDGGGADIPVTETNCVFAPSLPPGKQQPVLITARARASPCVSSRLLFARTLAMPSYPTFLPGSVKRRSRQRDCLILWCCFRSGPSLELRSLDFVKHQGDAYHS